jgi:hypothetical protein
MLGAGFRVISDGMHIYSDGILCVDPPGQSGPGGNGNTNGCSGSGSDSGVSELANWEAFNVCLDATTLDVDGTPADCTALSTSFTLNNASYATYTSTTYFQEITQDGMGIGNLIDQGPPTPVAAYPTPANFDLTAAVSNVSVASSISTSY